MNTQNKRDVYDIVSERIIARLESSEIPWKQSWALSGPPMNFITKRPYRGINILLLSSLSYETNYFLTLKQLSEIGGKVKEGEKSQIVVFWKWPDKNDTAKEEEQKKVAPILRYYSVFNIGQCEGIPIHMIPAPVINDNNPIDICENIVIGMPFLPLIKHKENRAYYHPFYDYINMPKIEKFDSSESYYDVLFHELVHSTGHQSRLNRKEVVMLKSNGADEYSFEELVAEIGSSFLNSIAGIDQSQFDNNVAYIKGWLAKLRNNKRFVIDAAVKAQKAVDFILDIHPHEEPTTIVEENVSSNVESTQLELA